MERARTWGFLNMLPKPPLFWKERVSLKAVFWASHQLAVSELPVLPVIVLWEFGMSLLFWT
jgi:hypothetical protein